MKKECDLRERAYKFVVYSAVSFSLLAILAACITMPIVYNFVEHIELQTKQELDYCKNSAQEIILQVGNRRQNLQPIVGKITYGDGNNRTRRQTGYEGSQTTKETNYGGNSEEKTSNKGGTCEGNN